MSVRHLAWLAAAGLIASAGCGDNSKPGVNIGVTPKPLPMLTGPRPTSEPIVVVPEFTDPGVAMNPLITPEAQTASSISEKEELWERFAAPSEVLGKQMGDIRFAFADLMPKAGVKYEPFEVELQAGVPLLNEGKYAEAAKHFENAQRLNPQDYRGFFFEAVCRAQLDDVARAAAAIDLAITRAPKELELYLHRGNLRMRRREYAAAAGDFSHVLSIQPQNIPALVNRAAANFHRRRPKDMIVDTTAVIDIRKDIPDAYLLRALGNIMTGEPARARRDFDAAVAAGLNKEAAASWRSLFYGKS